MENKESKNFKLINVLDNTCDTDRGIIRLVELHEYQGKVFKFMFENSNGNLCGYDHKHSVSVFNKNADEWKYLGDKRDIGAFSPQYIDYYNYFGDGAKLMQGAMAFMDACKRYVRALYEE